jgi:hypothetical protein
MSGRHRRPAPPRVHGKRLAGAGATGVVAVFALMPLANAAPVDTGTSDAPVDPSSSAAPSTDAPSSDTPSTEVPSTDVPSSDTPSTEVPSSDAPSSGAPSTEVPSSDTPSSSTSSGDAPATSAAPRKSLKAKAAVALADYGTRKVYVGVQLKDGSYAPNGTAGSVITIHETGPNAPAIDYTCTTVAEPAPNAANSVCPSSGPFAAYTIQAGDTATVTQTSAPDGTVADPVSQTLDLCPLSGGLPDPPFSSCTSTLAFFDTGVPPEAVDDGPYTVLTGTTKDLDVYANDDTHGAPLASVDVDQPAHGTVEVQQDATQTSRRALAATAVSGPFSLVYTPDAGYVGPDPFSYTLSTANGSSTAQVSLSVAAPPPTAKNDTATTEAGSPVTVDVTANDNAHGGGALVIGGASAPAHGTARVDGNDMVYTPADGFSGTDKFTYIVSTAYGTDSATVTVTVTAPPVTPASNDAGLANTGVPTETLVNFGGGLLLAGAAAATAGRRKRRYDGRHA